MSFATNGLLAALLLVATLPASHAQPAMTVDGQASSSACGSATCATTAGGFSSRSLTYSNGVFSGTITTNGCPSYVSTFTQATATCIQQTFPASSAYQNIGAAGKAAGLLGRVGLSLKGMNIYGPLEAGFSSGNGPTVCGTSGYYCAGGMDVPACIQELYWTCGSSQKSAVDTTVAGTTFGDTCGGHASAFHYHMDLKCEYAPNGVASPGAAHSPLVGIALDGRGIYGVWEGSGAAPVLDACNGHVGPVPGTYSANTGTSATSYITSGLSGMPTIPTTSVYHYHLSNTYPYTIGCFASQAMSNAQCRALYPGGTGTQGGCGTYIPAAYANGSTYFYDNWCPCANAGEVQGASPVSAVGAVPTLSGATCYSTASATLPATSTATVSCATSILTSYAGGSSSPSTTPPSTSPGTTPPSTSPGTTPPSMSPGTTPPSMSPGTKPPSASSGAAAWAPSALAVPAAMLLALLSLSV